MGGGGGPFFWGGGFRLLGRHLGRTASPFRRWGFLLKSPPPGESTIPLFFSLEVDVHQGESPMRMLPDRKGGETVLGEWNPGCFGYYACFHYLVFAMENNTFHLPVTVECGRKLLHTSYRGRPVLTWIDNLLLHEFSMHQIARVVSAAASSTSSAIRCDVRGEL